MAPPQADPRDRQLVGRILNASRWRITALSAAVCGAAPASRHTACTKQLRRTPGTPQAVPSYRRTCFTSPVAAGTAARVAARRTRAGARGVRAWWATTGATITQSTVKSSGPGANARMRRRRAPERDRRRSPQTGILAAVALRPGSTRGYMCGKRCCCVLLTFSQQCYESLHTSSSVAETAMAPVESLSLPDRVAVSTSWWCVHLTPRLHLRQRYACVFLRLIPDFE